METALIFLSGMVSIVAAVVAIVARTHAFREKSVTIQSDGEKMVLTKDSSSTQRQKAHKLLDEIAA